jgi:hypothetical protein
MDWVDHRLTPEHLRQLNELLEGKVGGEGKVFFFVAVNFFICSNC